MLPLLDDGTYAPLARARRAVDARAAAPARRPEVAPRREKRARAEGAGEAARGGAGEGEHKAAAAAAHMADDP